MKWFLLILGLLISQVGISQPDYQHGYAFLAKQKYDRGFEHFDYVNPEAPKGGPLGFQIWALGIVLIPFR